MAIKIPDDWSSPNWSNTRIVGDWKAYVGDELTNHWSNMDENSKKIIAGNLQELADLELGYWC